MKISQPRFSSQRPQRIGHSSSKQGSRANFISPSAVASARSGNEWFVRGERERERESLYYHIHEASISKSMSWSDGASGQRGRSHNQSLEECQCQGLARPRGDNETSSQSRVGPPQCFETILIAPFTILDRRSETKTPVGPRFC